MHIAQKQPILRASIPIREAQLLFRAKCTLSLPKWEAQNAYRSKAANPAREHPDSGGSAALSRQMHVEPPKMGGSECISLKSSQSCARASRFGRLSCSFAPNAR